jgi:cytochrome c2
MRRDYKVLITLFDINHYAVGLGFLVATLLGGNADAQNAKESAGRSLALEKCSECHVVAADQKTVPPILAILSPRLSPRTPGDIRIPTFEEVANWPVTSQEFLRKFIKSTHWRGVIPPSTVMPPPHVSEEEETKLIAYILSLRKAGEMNHPSVTSQEIKTDAVR